MTDAIVTSKEVIVGIIALVLAEVAKMSGIAFPLSPEQVLAAGVAGMGIIRVLFTEGKITSLLPKK